VIGILLAVVALAMFSVNMVVARLGAALLPISVGYAVTLTVNVAFAAVLLLVELAVRKTTLLWNGYGVLLFALAGVFTTYIGRIFIYESIAHMGPAKASAFQVSSPLFTFLIALVLLGERLDAPALVGMVLTVAGLLLVSLRGARAAPTSQSSASQLPGWLRSGWTLGLASSAAYAVGNVMRGAGIREWNEPVAGALVGAVVGMVLHLGVSSRHSSVLQAIRLANRRGVLLFGTSGVLTIAAQMLTIAAMKYTAVSIVALITLCTPLLVFPLSYFLLRNDEGINARTIVGAALTLGGMALIVLFGQGNNASESMRDRSDDANASSRLAISTPTGGLVQCNANDPATAPDTYKTDGSQSTMDGKK